MNKLSIRKLSILGLVLMAASAVTAAIIPSKKVADNGNHEASTGGSGGQLSCVTRIPGQAASCTLSEGTATTFNPEAEPGETTNGSSANGNTATASPSSHNGGSNTSVTGA